MIVLKKKRELLCISVTVSNLIAGLKHEDLAGTITLFGFRMIARIIKALVCVIRLQ